MNWLKRLLIEEGHDEPMGYLDRKDREEGDRRGARDEDPSPQR